MEFIINHKYFSEAISEVSKIISKKTTLPILSGIKVEAMSDHLIVTGSNSDITIEKIIPKTLNGTEIIHIQTTGCLVVSAKHLSELVRKLPDNISWKMNDKYSVRIQSGEIITSLNGLDAEEYPSLPKIEANHKISLPSRKLINIIKQTVFAVAKNEGRPVLTGVNFTFNQNELTCAATNSHRLARSKIDIKNNINGSFIVPSTSLNELIKLFSSVSTAIDIYTTHNYILFKSNKTSLYSRLIEGNFPSISSLISQKGKTIFSLNTKNLLNGVDRASLFADEWRNNNIHITIKDKLLIVSSKSTEAGKIEETLEIREISGEDELSVTLDGSFLMDALKEIEEDEVSVSYSGSMRPLVIQPVGNPSQLHLISPVRSY
ncbi:DNA polymerase III subunit beta [Oceanobacillus sp. FSL H7-0719]|uniref:DNA polymerase III subunit beta n=1 Tax=Oceanobacillus sp. FSL H7-0719 TaxID=2954507 RepID=UPI00324768BD